MLSIIIPSRGEEYLDNTINDILKKAEGEIEVIAVLDGVDAPRIDDPRVKYIYHTESIGMREAINSGVAIAKGKYLMKLDGHVIVAHGFDEQLKKDHQPDWIQIPRRYKLDEEKWAPDFNVFIDYEYYLFPLKHPVPSLHGYKWRERTQERQHILLDDTLTFQGSGYFVEKGHWDRHNFMKDSGYEGLQSQEATYIGSTTWLTGGRVVVNKKTWYSHLHKTKEKGRGYSMDRHIRQKCCAYSYNHWVNENREGFMDLIEKFMPLPNWPSNFRELL